MATKKNFTTQKSVFQPTRAPGSLVPWLGIAVIVILLDQITKITVAKLFTLGESMPVSTFFNVVLAYNEGAAFSFLKDAGGWQRYFFTAIGVGASIYIIHLLRRHTGQRLFCWSLALILGGAVGTVIDRVLYGHVIDFLDFSFGSWGHFPAFNIADSAISVGAALFIFDELRRVNRD